MVGTLIAYSVGLLQLINNLVARQGGVFKTYIELVEMNGELWHIRTLMSQVDDFKKGTKPKVDQRDIVSTIVGNNKI